VLILRLPEGKTAPAPVTCVQLVVEGTPSTRTVSRFLTVS